MKTVFALCFFFGLCAGVSPLADPPEVTLSNGSIETTLYLPDSQNGYYQGTRFDWAGAFKRLDYKGHSYVQQWFENYNPKTHDAINGPAEEFTALSFAETKPGDTFVKIGVGVLRKPNNKPYFFATDYEVVDPGKWTIKSARSQVEFSHELTDATGYGYRYTKTVRLTRGKPELVLEHRLKNTGQKLIETSVYNHNFFIIDHQPTGPTVAIQFPFAVKGEGKGFGSTIRAEGNQLVYSRELEKNEQVYSAGLQGYGPLASDYEFRLENRQTGAGLRATSDQPLEKLVFWACATTSCPEPYIHLKAAPGQEINWTIRYEFYQKPTP